MKQLSILIIYLLFCTSAVNAGWFSNRSEVPTDNREKITVLENQLSAQYQNLNQWKTAAGLLVICCVLLLVIGTALGAQTRKHYAESGRMGPAPTSTSLSTTTPIDGGPSIYMAETPHGDA